MIVDKLDKYLEETNHIHKPLPVEQAEDEAYDKTGYEKSKIGCCLFCIDFSEFRGGHPGIPVGERDYDGYCNNYANNSMFAKLGITMMYVDKDGLCPRFKKKVR